MTHPSAVNLTTIQQCLPSVKTVGKVAVYAAGAILASFLIEELACKVFGIEEEKKRESNNGLNILSKGIAVLGGVATAALCTEALFSRSIRMLWNPVQCGKNIPLGVTIGVLLITNTLIFKP